MRFKQARRTSKIPDLDLVPMMDVLMSILTFFIISAMSMQGSRSMLNVSLPQAMASVFGDRTQSSSRPLPKPLVVELDLQNQLAVNGFPLAAEQLSSQVQAYLMENPQGRVLLKADQRLPYAEVATVLKSLRAIGGDRVSLAIERAR